jgi:endonuclease-3 related protein
MEIYGRMYAHFGPRHWWPAATPFEVMVGAILTQNAAWSNVEKAVANLKRAGLLSPRKIARIDPGKLRTLIRPSGFYKEKTKKLKAFVKFLLRNSKKGISGLRAFKTGELREMLLGVKGIGPETADSMLLYAFGRPVFVVDAYTKRIFTRHALLGKDAGYDGIRKFFMRNLPGRDAKLFNEYHALIVEAGKNYCKKKKPLCEICPLKVVKRGKYMVY